MKLYVREFLIYIIKSWDIGWLLEERQKNFLLNNRASKYLLEQVERSKIELNLGRTKSKIV